MQIITIKNTWYKQMNTIKKCLWKVEDEVMMIILYFLLNQISAFDCEAEVSLSATSSTPAQLAGAAEYTDCTSAVVYSPEW